MSIGLDLSLLAAALEGYEAQLARLNSQIEQVKALLPKGKRTIDGPEVQEVNLVHKQTRRKRQAVGEEGRKRMAEAQRRRWAAYRGETIEA